MERFDAIVTKYATYLYSGSPHGAPAQIVLTCKREDDQQEYELRINFYESGAPLPPNSFEEENATGFASERIERYAGYVDLLRNQTPARASFGLEKDPPYFVVFSAP